jgi:diacylglycerol kinase (ATP)
VQSCVIFNPSARGEKAQAFWATLGDLFPNCVWKRTEKPGHARELAAKAVRDGFQTVVAGGGDGTVNEVVNGIGDVPGGFESTKFGVLPFGTINVFARELGLPLQLPKIARVLKEAKTAAIDLGCAEYAAGGGPKKRFFTQLAGAGLDSRAIELVEFSVKKKIGAMAYFLAGLRALREKQPVITACADKTVSGEMTLIGNGRFYGGSLKVFPAASLQDGLLHLCILPKVTTLRLIATIPGLLTGRFYSLSGAEHFSALSVTLTSESRVLLQLDGENVGELPATLAVRPKALRVIVP